MNILKKIMQRLCGCGKHDDREDGELLTAQLRLGPADILESDENGIIPEQDRVIGFAPIFPDICYHLTHY
ncbi:phage tail fiber C-terminal domain-containing protein, partial [Escherichia coli]|nr:phage tail fiber C-terminal domain-containing protein [Escherichia coli]